MSLTITLQTAASLAASTPTPATVTVATGLPGPAGLPGAAATIAVGSVSSVPFGTAPTITNVGTSSAAVFNFQLETGPQGLQGIQGPVGPAGPAGINTWGSITGTLSNQTDLQTALNAKAPIASPTFTGTVTIPSGASIAGYATQSYVTSQGYITSSALTPYLLSSTAALTYQTLSGMSAYLTTSAASSTYQVKAPNDGNYYIQQSGAWTQLIVY